MMQQVATTGSLGRDTEGTEETQRARRREIRDQRSEIRDQRSEIREVRSE
jgi:hypothetical protein